MHAGEADPGVHLSGEEGATGFPLGYSGPKSRGAKRKLETARKPVFIHRNPLISQIEINVLLSYEFVETRSSSCQLASCLRMRRGFVATRHCVESIRLHKWRNFHSRVPLFP